MYSTKLVLPYLSVATKYIELVVVPVVVSNDQLFWSTQPVTEATFSTPEVPSEFAALMIFTEPVLSLIFPSTVMSWFSDL